MKITQSHSFPQENSNVASRVLVAGVGIALGTTNALAVDPAWYTELQTQLTWIGASVVTVLGVVVGIRLAPLAWTHIRSVLYR